MIISASRRTDIPAFFGEWFLARLAAGWCRVPNPFNKNQVATVSLQRSDVDAFVFWTRNPKPFLPVLDVLDDGGYPYVFLYTITGYGPPLEPYAPGVEQAVLSFRNLARRIGAERVVWRYDPIVLGPGLSAAEHARRFSELASALAGATETVKISLVDLYRKTRRRMVGLEGGAQYAVDFVTHPQLEPMLFSLGEAAARAGMVLESCAEEQLSAGFGIRRGRCIDAHLLERLFDLRLTATRDPGQRPECLCAPSKDIGMTDTCLHGCVYCYATCGHEAAERNWQKHDPQSPALLPLR